MWNSVQYLKFKSQRTQPAIDLAKRIGGVDPKDILDIGCGPGNSTKVLQEAFPNARILGIDSSENMVHKARETYPDMEFRVMDITDEGNGLGSFDIIFSNACLQWAPGHRELIPRLFRMLRKAGTLAVQIPMNSQEKLFTIMNETLKEDKWDFSALADEPNATLERGEYFDILSALTKTFDIWETVYYHNMTSIDAMVEWVKGTRLRPYLETLDAEESRKLLDGITEKAEKAYERQENGEIIFRFRRFFFIAVR